MKKILMVNDNVYAGGSEIIMCNMAHYLCERDYEVTIMTYEDDIENIVMHYPTNVKYFSMKKIAPDENCTLPIYDIRRIIKGIYRRINKKIILNNINKENYDVVIAMKEGLVTMLLQDIKAKKKIGWIHVDYNNLYWTKGWYGSEEKELECMKKYDHIVCVSQATMDSVKNVIGDPGNLVLCENPIDVNRIIKLGNQKYKDKLLRDKSYMDKTILVSVGRLCEHKDYMSLLRALARVRNIVNKPFELWLIGDGKELKALRSYAKEYNLKQVRFLGYRDNPYPYIKKADWFVTTTKGESYGLAVSEALILGVPILATRCAAFEECVDEDEAILVEHSVDDIYNGLVKILCGMEVTEKYKESVKDRTYEEYYLKRLQNIEKLF